MKSYVITIEHNPASVAIAERCIASGQKFGIEIQKWSAYSPEQDDVYAVAAEFGINPKNFKEIWSRADRCTAAFLSHFRLWWRSTLLNEEIQIFEHDAVIVNKIPEFIDYKGCISLGKPSYGRWNTPSTIGVNPLTSKRYFPGAHAYRIKPATAQLLIDRAKQSAGPTDVFLHVDNFPFLEEYYPWPVEVQETFTTIQNENGVKAKHGYNDKYKII